MPLRATDPIERARLYEVRKHIALNILGLHQTLCGPSTEVSASCYEPLRYEFNSAHPVYYGGRPHAPVMLACGRVAEPWLQPLFTDYAKDTMWLRIPATKPEQRLNVWKHNALEYDMRDVHFARPSPVAIDECLHWVKRSDLVHGLYSPIASLNVETLSQLMLDEDTYSLADRATMVATALGIYMSAAVELRVDSFTCADEGVADELDMLLPRTVDTGTDHDLDRVTLFIEPKLRGRDWLNRRYPTRRMVEENGALVDEPTDFNVRFALDII